MRLGLTSLTRILHTQNSALRYCFVFWLLLSLFLSSGAKAIFLNFGMVDVAIANDTPEEEESKNPLEEEERTGSTIDSLLVHHSKRACGSRGLWLNNNRIQRWCDHQPAICQSFIGCVSTKTEHEQRFGLGTARRC
jgi:hypothetical protein